MIRMNQILLGTQVASEVEWKERERKRPPPPKAKDGDLPTVLIGKFLVWSAKYIDGRLIHSSPIECRLIGTPAHRAARLQLKRGDHVFIRGELRTRRYRSPGGHPQLFYFVHVHRLTLLWPPPHSVFDRFAITSREEFDRLQEAALRVEELDLSNVPKEMLDEAEGKTGRPINDPVDEDPSEEPEEMRQALREIEPAMIFPSDLEFGDEPENPSE